MHELFNTFETKDWISLGAAAISVLSIGVNIYLNRTQYRKNITIENKKHKRDIFFDFYKKLKVEQRKIDDLRFDWDLSDEPPYSYFPDNFTQFYPSLDESLFIAKVYLHDFIEPLEQLKQSMSNIIKIQESTIQEYENRFEGEVEIIYGIDEVLTSGTEQQKEKFTDFYTGLHERALVAKEQFLVDFRKLIKQLDDSTNNYSEVNLE